MKVNLNIFKLEDDLNFFYMEDNLKDETYFRIG